MHKLKKILRVHKFENSKYNSISQDILTTSTASYGYKTCHLKDSVI